MWAPDGDWFDDDPDAPPNPRGNVRRHLPPGVLHGTVERWAPVRRRSQLDMQRRYGVDGMGNRKTTKGTNACA